MPLRWDAAGGCPVLDGALAPAEKGGKRALAAEAANDAFGSVMKIPVHALTLTVFSLGEQDASENVKSVFTHSIECIICENNTDGVEMVMSARPVRAVLVPLGILHHDAWLSGFWASCHLSCCLGYEVGSPCEESFVAAEVG